MSTRSSQLLTKHIPEAFNGAIAELKALADQGDSEAAARYADQLATPGAARVVLEGGGGLDVYLVFENGVLRVEHSAPSVPVLFAVGLPLEALDLTIEELEDEIQSGLAKLRRRLTRISPKKTRPVLDRIAAEQLRFHLVVTDTPDFDEVRVKIATGASEPPDKPAFTITIAYETFEQLRARKLKPQALLSKLKLSGDSARAMQLGMELMQRRT